MRGKINLRFLLIVTLAFVVLATAWFFVHRVQKKRRLGDYLTQATRAEKEEKFDRAARLLRAYVLAAPEDIDSRVRYGGLLEKISKTPRAKADALSVYEQALLRNPDRLDARTRAVELSVELGRTDDALKHIKELPETNRNDARVLFLEGLCRESRKEYETTKGTKEANGIKGAIELYDQSCRADPKAEVFVRWASVLKLHLKREDKPEDATEPDRTKIGPLAVMNELVKARPNEFDSYLARALYLKTYHKNKSEGLEMARADLKKAQELAPDEVLVLLTSAQVAVESAAQITGPPDDARKARERLGRSTRLPPSRAEQIEEGVAVRCTGQRRSACGPARRGNRSARGRAQEVRPDGLPDVLFALCELYAESGEEASAKEVVAQLVQLKQDPTRIDFLRGLLLVRREKWYEGSGILERVRPLLAINPDMTVRIDMLLARCYYELGDTERQLLTYRHAVAAAPLDDRPRLGLADTLVALGRSAEAIDEYRRITQLERSPSAAWMSLTRLMVSRTLALSEPERNWTEVDGLLQKLERAADSVELDLLRAEIFVAKGNLAAAEQLLIRRRAAKPKEAEVWFALAVLADRDRNDPKSGNARANAILDQAKLMLGDTVDLRIARLRVTKFESAEPVLEALARDTQKFPENDRLRLLRTLAAAYLLIDRPAAANRLWAEIVGLRPNDLAVRLLQFDAALKEGNEQGMRDVLDKIRGIEGGGPLWRCAEANRLIWRASEKGGGDRSGLEKARNLLTEASAGRPGWSRISLALARIDELLGDPGSELEHLKQAIDFGDRQFSVVRRVTELLDERGRVPEADTILDTILRNSDAQANYSQFQQLAAEVSLPLDVRRALDLAQKAVSKNTKDYKERIWLGRILSIGGDAKKATDEFEAAIAIAGDKREVWEAYVQHAVRHRSNPNVRRVDKVLELAHAKLVAREPLALARCYDYAGQRKEAEEWYGAAYRSNNTDVGTLLALADFYQRGSEPEKAKKYLRELINKDSKTTDKDRAWARRNLALAIGLRKESPDFEGALQLLDRNAEAGEKPEDLRARAIVLATRPGHRQEVISLLEEAKKKLRPAPEHEFLLAKLYEAEGDWHNASECMLGLIATQKNNARYLEAFARSLIKKKDIKKKDWDRGEALVWIRRLADAGPGVPAAESAGRALVAAELFDLAGAGQDAKEARDTAERFYKVLKERPQEPEPERTLALAGLYARNDRPDEALDLCEVALMKLPLEQVIAVGLTATSEPSAKEVHFAKVEGWLNRAMTKSPNAHDLRFLLATLREQQGRYEEAESEYRKVLAKVPTHAGALNNMAYLHALQGKGTKAVEEAQRALKATTVAPPELLDTRAVAYTAAGDLENAKKDLIAATAKGGQATAYFHLAVVYWKLNKKDEARDALQDARKAGLRPGLLHPLERPTYDRLVKELK